MRDLTQKHDNTNRGALFRNHDKTDDKHADYRGSINVEGTEYWLNAWINESKQGTKYMALRLKPKEPATAKPELNDEVPF